MFLEGDFNPSSDSKTRLTVCRVRHDLMAILYRYVGRSTDYGQSVGYEVPGTDWLWIQQYLALVRRAYKPTRTSLYKYK
jgi:hypothetical protein